MLKRKTANAFAAEVILLGLWDEMEFYTYKIVLVYIGIGFPPF